MSRILVVDDERNIVQLVRLYLSKEGYEVEAAGNGRKALEKAGARPPDRVVLDLMLPEIGGLAAGSFDCVAARADDTGGRRDG